MNKTLIVLVALLWGAAAPVMAEDSGQALYQACASCHGAAALGNDALNAPALAGQRQDYMERQLQHFKQGIRGADPKDSPGAQMAAMAATLPTNEAVTAVATYLAAMPVSAVPAPQSGDMRNGNNLYHGHCGACHGGRAEGNDALHAPMLSGLSAAYIVRQFQNFQQGLRGSHAADKYGRQMQLMSNSLSSRQDLDDVIAYIQSQSAAP